MKPDAQNFCWMSRNTACSASTNGRPLPFPETLKWWRLRVLLKKNVNNSRCMYVPNRLGQQYATQYREEEKRWPAKGKYHVRKWLEAIDQHEMRAQSCTFFMLPDKPSQPSCIESNFSSNAPKDGLIEIYLNEDTKDGDKNYVACHNKM